MIEINRQRRQILRDARREHVCILFVDISGFTRLAQAVEPEVVYLTVRPLLDRLVDVVLAHSGVIQQVLGDGFMAAFGLDGKLKDAVGNAVCAGMDLVSAAHACSASMPVHVGIESGEVLVTPSWEPARFGVWGHSVNVAKRLCDLARSGEIQLGPNAFDRVRHRLAPLTSILATCKNIAGEVVAYRLTRDRLTASGLDGPPSWRCSRFTSRIARSLSRTPGLSKSTRTASATGG